MTNARLWGQALKVIRATNGSHLFVARMVAPDKDHPMHFLAPLDRQRLQRGAEHLHQLGPRAEAEFLAEIGAKIGGMPAILRLLAEYQQRLTPAMIRVTGADRFSPRPLHAVAP